MLGTTGRNPETTLWPVIPAGGSGTRLWPLSRTCSPKFLHDLTGSGRSLLQATWDRLEPLAPSHIIVVTGVAHATAVRQQLPGLDEGCLIAEPSPRDSMPAIGLAAALLELRDPEAVIGSFAADHVIAEPEAFRSCVNEAVAVAQAGYLVTLGIEPTRAATGFGYIRTGEPLSLDGAPHARLVEGFVEKPDEMTARKYLRSGKFRWNAGIFVVRAATLLDLLARYQPALAKGLRDIAADPTRLTEIWPSLTKISIDHAVAEPAAVEGQMAMVPGSFGWDDVGDFVSLAGLLEGAAEANSLTVLGDRDLVVAHETTGVVIPSAARTVVALGVDGIVVVDTPDVLLVTTRARAQDVKLAVQLLNSSGRQYLT